MYLFFEVQMFCNKTWSSVKHSPVPLTKQRSWHEWPVCCWTRPSTHPEPCWMEWSNLGLPLKTITEPVKGLQLTMQQYNINTKFLWSYSGGNGLCRVVATDRLKCFWWMRFQWTSWSLHEQRCTHFIPTTKWAEAYPAHEFVWLIIELICKIKHMYTWRKNIVL